MPLCAKKQLFMEHGEDFFDGNDYFYGAMLDDQEHTSAFMQLGIELYGDAHNFLNHIDVPLLTKRLILIEIGVGVCILYILNSTKFKKYVFIDYLNNKFDFTLTGT